MNTLKYLPWRSLFLASILAVVVMKAIDLLAARSVLHLGNSSALAQLLITPAGYILLFVCGGLALGGLGVSFLERLAANGPIYASTLWALVLCLLISAAIATYFPIDGLGLAGLSQPHAMTIIVGVFWRGKPYWR